MNSNVIIIYCPFPSADAARVACCALLEAKHIACGNILPMGESHYWWEGALVHTEECIFIAKTTADMVEAATQQLAAMHPYSCPAILSFSASANPAFAAWVTASIIDSTLTA